MEDVYFMTIWSIVGPLGIFFRPFVIFYGHLAYFSRFGMLYEEKSGNPGTHVLRLPTSKRRALKQKVSEKLLFQAG
jgi:hypothetical protein